MSGGLTSTPCGSAAVRHCDFARHCDQSAIQADIGASNCEKTVLAKSGASRIAGRIVRHVQDTDALLQLIEKVYAAAVDQSLWPTLAPEVANTFNSTSTTLQLTNRGEDRPELLSITDNLVCAIDEYRDYFWQRDIWIDRASELRTSGIVASRDLLSDSEFERSEFYRDWSRHIDAFYVLGAVFPAGPRQFGVLGIHRPRVAGTYQEADKAFASHFLPHLQRALQLRSLLTQLAFDRRVSLNALERTDSAIFVLGENQKILIANLHAQSLLKNSGGLVSKQDRLMASHHSTNERLLVLIRDASDITIERTAPSGALAIPRRHGMPLTAFVAPFRIAQPGGPTSSVIVFVRDPQQSISTPAALQALFTLTFAEARIAHGLANGQSLNEIALAQGTHPQTVRKQLKGIFLKTGTQRQAQLVAVILRSVASFIN